MNNRNRVLKPFLRPGILSQFLSGGIYSGLSGATLQSLLFGWGLLLFLRLGGSFSNFSARESLTSVAKYFRRILETQGMRQVLLRMKVGIYVVNSYLAGTRIKDTRHLGVSLALTGSLPAFLPLAWRVAIRRGNVGLVRVIVSLLTAYKAIESKYGLVDTSSITALPPTLEFNQGHEAFNKLFWQWFNPANLKPQMAGAPFRSGFSAGPNVRPSILGAPFDALAWSLIKENNHLIRFCNAFGQNDIIQNYTNLLEMIASDTGKSLRRLLSGSEKPSIKRLATHSPILGKLSLKYEAAGKIRVFAIVDSFTQSALAPLHDFLFSRIKRLEVDATFDQEGAVQSFSRDHVGWDVFSYDLSSATDLIPITLTTYILDYLIPGKARLWAKLLVERDYLLPGKNPGRKFIRYTRGQPIGALSSWAALALTHHWVVQFSAFKVAKFPYTHYRVLGDDVVIAGKEVAESYKSTCLEFGIPINNKGIESLAGSSKFSSLTNFANQVLSGEVNFSPISLKEDSQVTGLSARAEALARVVRRGLLSVSDPKFLVKAFRMSSSSPYYLVKGLRDFSRGVFPRGFKELLLIFLFPAKGKPWTEKWGNPFSYSFFQLITGFGSVWNWAEVNTKEIPNVPITREKALEFVKPFLEFINSEMERFEGLSPNDTSSEYGSPFEEDPSKKWFSNTLSYLPKSLLQTDSIKPDANAAGLVLNAYARPLLVQYFVDLINEFDDKVWFAEISFDTELEGLKKLMREIPFSSEAEKAMPFDSDRLFRAMFNVMKAYMAIPPIKPIRLINAELEYGSSERFPGTLQMQVIGDVCDRFYHHKMGVLKNAALDPKFMDLLEDKSRAYAQLPSHVRLLEEVLGKETGFVSALRSWSQEQGKGTVNHTVPS